MNRPLTALLAGLESLLVAGIGFGALLVPLTALWAFQYELAVDWGVFYRAAADTWLLGHGVDVRFALDPALVGALGLPPTDTSFVVTVGALGVALATAVLAARTGSRLRQTDHPRLAVTVAVAVFAVLSAVLALSAGTSAAQPSRWQGVLLPTAVFAAGLAVGWRLRRRGEADGRVGMPGRGLGRLGVSADWSVLLREGARMGLAAVAALFAASAVLVALLLVFGYAQVVTLYESLQGNLLGGAVLTLGQLALLPNLVLWTAAWLLGPGFALGAGSSVSPLGTVVGPVPALPVLGALPAGDLGWGFLGLLVPIVPALLCAALLRPRLDRALSLPSSPLELAGAGASAGVTSGVVLGLLTWAASGSAGPGRLASVGASPLLVGAVAALEIGVAVSLGLLSGRHRTTEPHAVPSLQDELRR